jgi:pimeloyl-ACP methyl ester carboxylesterase
MLNRGQHQIAYHASAGRSPTVIFCGGFNSSMQGNKALALEQFCRARGQAFIRFDYFGHGESSGNFADGKISTWLQDTEAVIDHLAQGDVVLVGSSMGGWLALLAALRNKARVKALLLIACAADMTMHFDRRLQNVALEYDAAGRAFYRVDNKFDDMAPYSIYQQLIDDGLQYKLLEQTISLNIPVQLIHGYKDDVVPWQRSVDIMQCLSCEDVELTLIKGGDHRLSSDHELEKITTALETLLADNKSH